MRHASVLFVVMIFAFACGTKEISESNVAKSTDGLDLLVSLMEGSFNSAEQAKNDSDFYSIDLHMTKFLELDGVHYLYVEQALSSTPEAPYRQRVYQVSKISDSEYKSEIFLISNEEEFIGSHLNEDLLKQMSMDSITLKEGCAVFLTQSSDSFKGATGEGTCLSGFRGATYTSSEVTIDSQGVLSWDRGWNDLDEQVWGAVKGGYYFKKMY